MEGVMREHQEGRHTRHEGWLGEFGVEMKVKVRDENMSSQ